MAVTIDLARLDGTELPSIVDLGIQNRIQLSLRLIVTGQHQNQEITGQITKNGQIICRFTRSVTGALNENWYNGRGQPLYVRDGDKIIATVTSPLNTSVTKTIKRQGAKIVNDKRLQFITEESKQFLDTQTKNSDVLREAIHKMGDYQDITHDIRQAMNVRNIERYVHSELELPPVTANIFSSQSELQDALAQLKPTTQKDIFQTWPRFFFEQDGSGQRFWSDPSTATGAQATWQWQENNQRVWMPVNQHVWTGFISTKKYEEYDHEMTTGSNDQDDDWNAIVIGHKWDAGINHLLMVIVSTDNHKANWPGNRSTASIVQYTGGGLALHSNTPNHWSSVTTQTIPLPLPVPGGHWNGKEIRIGVSRRGDEITVKLSSWNQTEYDPANTTTIDLNSSQILRQFKGPLSYGYANMSQGQTYYKDIFFDGGERMDTITFQPTGEVYTYDPQTGWNVEQDLNLADIFGQPRTIINQQDGVSYTLNVDGSITRN